MSFLSRRRRGNRQPDVTLSGETSLQCLHVAAVVMLPNKRAPVVGPFKDNGLAAVISEAPRLPGDIPRGESGRRRTRVGLYVRGSCRTDEECQSRSDAGYACRAQDVSKAGHVFRSTG